MVVRKCLGISEDSCFCGTSDDLSLGSSVIIGSGEERSQAKGSLALCGNFCFSCRIALEYLLWLCLMQFLSALHVSHAFLPGSLSSSSPSAGRPAAL